MKNPQHHPQTRRPPSPPAAHRPKTPPWVIRSNSAYETDGDHSSVASNGSFLHERFQSWEMLSAGLVDEEELRLREELAREIEKELERELMEGIASLVRRLSDLRARQIVRAVREPHRRPWDEFAGDGRVDARVQRHSKNGVRKCGVREGKTGVKSGAAGRTMVVDGGGRGGCNGGDGGLDVQCSDAESRTTGRRNWGRTS